MTIYIVKARFLSALELIRKKIDSIILFPILIGLVFFSHGLYKLQIGSPIGPYCLTEIQQQVKTQWKLKAFLANKNIIENE